MASARARYIKKIKRKWGEKWLCTREISSSSAILCKLADGKQIKSNLVAWLKCNLLAEVNINRCCERDKSNFPLLLKYYTIKTGLHLLFNFVNPNLAMQHLRHCHNKTFRNCLIKQELFVICILVPWRSVASFSFRGKQPPWFLRKISPSFSRFLLGFGQ